MFCCCRTIVVAGAAMLVQYSLGYPFADNTIYYTAQLSSIHILYTSFTPLSNIKNILFNCVYVWETIAADRVDNTEACLGVGSYNDTHYYDKVATQSPCFIHRDENIYTIGRVRRYPERERGKAEHTNKNRFVLFSFWTLMPAFSGDSTENPKWEREREKKRNTRKRKLWSAECEMKNKWSDAIYSMGFFSHGWSFCRYHCTERKKNYLKVFVLTTFWYQLKKSTQNSF